MFAAIYLPNFALQAALRHQPELREKAVALIDDEQSKATIMQLTESAAAASATIEAPRDGSSGPAARRSSRGSPAAHSITM